MNWEFCTVICVHCPNSRTIEALLCCEIPQWWTPPSQISESSKGMVPESVTCIWHHLAWMFRPWISVTVIALVCLGFAIWLGKQLALSTVCPSYIHSETHSWLGEGTQNRMSVAKACLPPFRPLNCCLGTHCTLISGPVVTVLCLIHVLYLFSMSTLVFPIHRLSVRN